MFVGENSPQVAASSMPGLPHSGVRPFVVYLDEDVLQSIKVMSEARA